MILDYLLQIALTYLASISKGHGKAWQDAHKNSLLSAAGEQTAFCPLLANMHKRRTTALHSSLLLLYVDLQSGFHDIPVRVTQQVHSPPYVRTRPHLRHPPLQAL